MILPKFIGISAYSIDELAEPLDFLKGIRYVKEDQFCVFRSDVSPSDVDVKCFALLVAVAELLPPLYCYWKDEAVGRHGWNLIPFFGVLSIYILCQQGS